MENEGIDDGADRLNHLYTTTLFIIVTVILDLSQFVGKPIKCFTPKTFSRPQTRLGYKSNGLMDRFISFYIDYMFDCLIDCLMDESIA